MNIISVKINQSEPRMSSALLRVKNIGGKYQLEVQRMNHVLSQYPETVNMVSIFGAPRGGKSWLIGELSTTPGCFTTAPGNAKSCTSGVDICDSIVPIREYSGGKGTASGRIAFVDCEGMGDHDTAYDTVLYCPILLLSRLVMLNWKGGLQKSEILSYLQALVTIAQRFGVSSTLKLGHLYFILRDADELDTSAAVRNTLFEFDNDATLNLYRRSILNTFESVQVFCFPPPSDRFTMRKQDFHLEDCDPDFQQLFRAMQQKMVSDLSTPRSIHAQPLTGSFISATIEATVTALNSGAANVFPRSIAQTLVDNIITAECKAAEEIMNTTRINQPAMADPNAIAASLQRTLDESVRELQKKLLNYDQERINAVITELRRTQLDRNEVTVQGVVESITQSLNDCFRRAVASPINRLQREIAEDGAATATSVATRCDACKQVCLAAFDREATGRGIGMQWDIMRGHRATVSNELDGLLNTIRHAHEQLENHSTIFGFLSSRIYRRRLDVDLMPAIMAFSLNDNAAINDTTHQVLRSVDLLRLLPNPPIDRMTELMHAVTDQLAEHNAQNPQSRHARVMRKGLDALLDQGFLNTMQECGSVHVTVRSVVLRVWEVIRVHMDKSQMLLRLCEELYDSRPAGYDVAQIFISDICRFHNCPGGIVTRLLNTLRGFCNVPGHPIDPALREGFLHAFSHRVLRHATMDARLAEATAILDEYGVLDDRDEWLNGVREQGDIACIALAEPLMEEPDEDDESD